MRYITVIVGTLLFASPSPAETPCDFKGISVGNKMPPAQLMSALGVTQYKTNPAPHSPSLALTGKYGFIAAGEIEDWEIGPYCNNTMCTVPHGVAVGNNNNIPVKVDISFHEGLITKIHEPVSTSKSRLYGAGELSGVGTMICGLRLSPPASVAADGIVASLNAGPVMVARPGIGAIVTLLPKASVASVVLAAALQAPVVTDVPKEEIAGAVAPGGSCGASIPVVGSALLASTVVLGAAAAIPVVGHVMIVPMAPPEIVAGVPSMNWIAPSGLAPGVGMVPGTLDVVRAASDVVTVADNVVAVVGDVMPDAGALRVDVVLTCCASVELQPIKTMAAVMRTKLRIGASYA